MAEIHAAVPKTVSLERNHKDEPFLDLAVASGAAYLVTRDKDMLDLMADPGFTSRYPGLRIVGPVELLREPVPPLTPEPEKEQGLQP